MHHETPDCPVRAGAERNPAALLIDSAEETVTYAEADAMMDGIAARLRTHGVNQGDRVAIHAAPSIAYVLTLFSCWRHGFTACPLHQRRPEAWIQDYVRS